MRAIDAVDRTHARAATALHGVRNDVRGTLERARKTVQKADALGANAVNRAQGAINHALDMAREVGAKRVHLPS